MMAPRAVLLADGSRFLFAGLTAVLPAPAARRSGARVLDRLVRSWRGKLPHLAPQTFDSVEQRLGLGKRRQPDQGPHRREQRAHHGVAYLRRAQNSIQNHRGGIAERGHRYHFLDRGVCRAHPRVISFPGRGFDFTALPSRRRSFTQKLLHFCPQGLVQRRYITLFLWLSHVLFLLT